TAVAAVPPPTTDGLIPLQGIMGQDEGPTGHVSAAAGRHAPVATEAAGAAVAADEDTGGAGSAGSAVPPLTTEGWIALQPIIGQDEAPAAHAGAAAGRHSPGATGATGAAGAAGSGAAVTDTALGAVTPARDVATDDVVVQRQAAAVEVDAATE